MREIAIDHEWLTTTQYCRLNNGVGIKEIKSMIDKGILEGYKTEGGQYKIKVYKNDAITKERYEKILEENGHLKAKIEALKSIVN